MSVSFPEDNIRLEEQKGVLVEDELASFSNAQDSALTIGVFDGVHLGHRHLLAELVKQARQTRLRAGVVTFRQHPEDLLTKGKKLPFLTDIETRVKLLEAAGADFVVPLTFSPELAALDARDFILLLQKYLKMRRLVVGPDFALGKGRRGDIDTLKQMGAELGFTVTIVPPLKLDGEVVSSTAIRRSLADGDMEKYHRLTGHPFILHGRVIIGAGRGGGLGFPTANLDVRPGQAMPPDGVYAGLAHINGNTFQAMTNIGCNPTFGKNERTVESFLIDYKGDLYGRELSVDFVARLRKEIKFKSPAELKQQLAEDVRRGRSILEAGRSDK